MKKIVIISLFSLLLISVGNLVLAQEYLDFNTGAGKTKRILLVPFDPRIYFNDATAIIAQEDGATHDEIMSYFREQFNLQLYNAMMDSCVIINLFTDNTREAQDDISGLYSAIRYVLLPAEKNNPEDIDDIKKSNFLTKRKEEREAQRKKEEMANAKTRMQNGEIVGQRQSVDDMFLHIVFEQPQVLTEIAKRRNVDLFLFINEFDIKGNYGDAYISGNSKNERTMKVHFSLYNAQGVLIHGSFGETKIPFELSDRKEIVNSYFPEVIRQIIHNIEF